MSLADELLLSDLWREDVRRLHRAETDLIIAQHRMRFEAHRLSAEAAKRKHKDFLS